jgi:DNA-binding XRE family transcriptional regulator
MTHSDKKHFYESLGNRIKEARSTAKIRQETFASYLSLSRSSIVNIEKGRQHPQIHLLCDIARILNIKIADLLPEQSVMGEISSQWSKIIAQGSRGNKKTKEKLMSFVEEVKSSKK